MLASGCSRDVCSGSEDKKRTNPSFYSTGMYEVPSMCEELCETLGIYISEQIKRCPALCELLIEEKFLDYLRQCFNHDNCTSGKTTVPISVFPEAYISVGEPDYKLVIKYFIIIIIHQ